MSFLNHSFQYLFRPLIINFHTLHNLFKTYTIKNLNLYRLQTLNGSFLKKVICKIKSEEKCFRSLLCLHFVCLKNKIYNLMNSLPSMSYSVTFFKC